MRWYRCTKCRTVVSPKDIKSGNGCRKCKGIKISPTDLTVFEKVIEGIRWPSMFFKSENYKHQETL